MSSSTRVPELADSETLERMHQTAVNQWSDGEASGEFDVRVDAADLSKITQELRIYRALARGEPAPEMKVAEPLDAY